MTELDIRQPDQAPAVVTEQPANRPVGASLEKWAREASAISGIAAAIANTSLAGAYRGKRDEIVAVILAGHELGIQPMTSLKSIDVIQGQPALRAHAMRGILQAQGHEIELKESDDTHCVMRGRRKGAEEWQTVVWDIPRVTRMGLLGKDQWKKQPKTMLIARATGEICRLVASDALHGMPYAAEELDAQPRISVEQVAPARPLSVAALTAAPVRDLAHTAPPAAEDTGWQPDPAPHEWDVNTLAATLGMSDADLDERCHRLTGAPLATANAEQIRALTQSLADEMVRLDNAPQ